MTKARECIPSKYAVVDSVTKRVTYGWRCARCGIATKRYSTEELRDTRHNEHIKEKKWK